MTIFKREEELFKEWEKSRTPFVRDGAVSEHDYLKSCPRIAFILKEANDPGVPKARLLSDLLDAIKEIKEYQE